MSRRINWAKAPVDWDKLVWAFAADPEGQLGAFRERLSYADRRHWLATLGVRVKVWATGHDPPYEITMAVDPVYWVPTEEDSWKDALPEDEWLQKTGETGGENTKTRITIPSASAPPLKQSVPAIAVSPLSTSRTGSG
jgi:hypothetical protein